MIRMGQKPNAVLERLKVFFFSPRYGVYPWAFLLILVGRLIQYMTQETYTMYPDSYTYIEYQSAGLLRLEFTNSQPPMYAILLDVMDFIGRLFGVSGLVLIVRVQMFFSFAVLLFLAKTLQQLDIGPKLATAAILLYGLNPGSYSWDTCILTESFSISGVILWFYLVVCFVQGRDGAKGILAVLLSAFLLFLRPQFLVYPVLLAVYCVLRLFLESGTKKMDLLGTLAALLVLGGIVCGYCRVFQKQFGLFSISDAKPRQDMIVFMQRELYHDSSDEEFVQVVERALEQATDGKDGSVDYWWAMCIVRDYYGNARMEKVLRQCILENPGQYLKDRVLVMADCSMDHFYGYYHGSAHTTILLLGLGVLMRILFEFVTVGHAMLAALVQTVVMVVVWVRRRRPPWIHMALCSISMTTVYLTFFVTCGEYMRTMVSVLPYLYVMAAMALQWLCVRWKNRERKL